MTSEQSTRRFRLFMLVALMSALALGSFWALEVMRRNASDFIPDVTRTAPDLYVDHFSYVKMSETGEPRYHVSGDKLTHNPKDDSYDVVNPVLKSLTAERPPTTLRSDRAEVNSDGSEMHMYDNVHMDRPATPRSERLQVKSEYMLILPDDDVAKTEKPVQITLGESTLNGIGMYVNNATRELRLSSRVQGSYHAPVR
ncbi:LPS export ABC transporter periplasmic protein LptC [Noviherbaspirillum cavernae]|uniref:LPS export ABC transporter periplasmic protein LptC n=1 Tax=Noviherbaspirillum cavernae TaxID=2320862 RepID=A0A418X4G5_9BURK|nr:LPS export ABC transporter periplasmic protein LptC [Noviherbaspirillum cavernae]RJG07281.1 LPS export ABC transporter periplasmic protein LptC [Noviherbaspirillum cavernae]